MCVNCISHSEQVVAQAAWAVALFRDPAHRFLADLGLVDAPLPVARDARTVSFLRALDLDADDVLGTDMVAAADAWVAAGQPRPSRSRMRALASARPMRSHIALATP